MIAMAPLSGVLDETSLYAKPLNITERNRTILEIKKMAGDP